MGSARNPRVAAEGVVEADTRTRGPDGHLVEVAFARQAMRKLGSCRPDPDRVAGALARHVIAHLPKGGGAWSWSLQVVAPDGGDPKDPRRAVAAALEEALPAALDAALPPEVTGQRGADDEAARLVQAWVVAPDAVWLGVTPANQALSRVPGGKTKLKRPADAVSRSGLKLEEAIVWAGVGPDRGEICADLGAAPGGWTQVVAARGATVIAVDPAKMKVDLPKKRFAHAQQSAFEYAPPETLDWVVCDMAWRPFEVAQLLAKWGRRVWARQLIANFKLPMKQKAAMLRKVLKTLEKGGWRGLRARQLFHDRDEVTIFGFLDPGLVVLGPKPAFEMKSKAGGRKKAPGRPGPRPNKPSRGRARGRGPRRGGPRRGGPRRGGPRRGGR